MIANSMNTYSFYTLGEDDGYGQASVSQYPTGKIKMSINLNSHSATDSILYQDCEYVGLTHNANVDDTYIIEYGKERLKVKFVNPAGRYKQVFMVRQ